MISEFFNPYLISISLSIEEEFQRSFNFDSYLIKKGTRDPITHVYRIYKAKRLPNLNTSMNNK